MLLVVHWHLLELSQLLLGYRGGSALLPNLPLRPTRVGDALSGCGETTLALLIQAQGNVMVPADPGSRGGE